MIEISVENKRGAIKFLAYGFIYCFVIKNYFTISWRNQDFVYLISNPSIDEELWYLTAISYFCLLYFLGISWLNSFYVFCNSFNFFKKIAKRVLQIKLEKIINFLNILLFLATIFIVLTLFAFWGSYSKPNEKTFPSLLFILYFFVIVRLSIKKKLKKILN